MSINVWCSQNHFLTVDIVAGLFDTFSWTREAGSRTIKCSSSTRSGILKRCDVYLWSLPGRSRSLPDTFPVYALCAHGAGPKAECKEEDGFTRFLYTDFDGFQAVFPRVAVLQRCSRCDLTVHLKVRLAALLHSAILRFGEWSKDIWQYVAIHVSPEEAELLQLPRAARTAR